MQSPISSVFILTGDFRSFYWWMIPFLSFLLSNYVFIRSIMKCVKQELPSYWMSLTLSHPITNPLYRMCIMFPPSCISPNLCDHVIRHLNIVRSKLYQSWIRIKDIARARNIMVYEYNVTMKTVKPTSPPPLHTQTKCTGSPIYTNYGGSGKLIANVSILWKNIIFSFYI